MTHAHRLSTFSKEKYIISKKLVIFVVFIKKNRSFQIFVTNFFVKMFVYIVYAISKQLSNETYANECDIFAIKIILFYRHTYNLFYCLRHFLVKHKRSKVKKENTHHL